MEYLDKVKAAADQMMGGGQKEKVVLTYFPIASRGEVARLICAVGGLDFENNATGALPEGEVPIDYMSPKSMPMLKHGDFKMAQSLPVEAYAASIAPLYSGLTPQQKAIDGTVCAIKEDINAGCIKLLFDGCEDAAKVRELLDPWFKIIEHKCPESGFFHGLAFPTAADFAVFVVTNGYMPFQGLFKQAGLGETWYEADYPKLAALAKRTGEYPAVKDYLASSTTLKQAAFGK